MSSSNSSKLDRALGDIISENGSTRTSGSRGGRRGGRGGARRGGSSSGNGSFRNPLSRDDDDSSNTGPVRRERFQNRNAPYSRGDVNGDWKHDRFNDRANDVSTTSSSGSSAPAQVHVSNLDPELSQDDVRKVFDENAGKVSKVVLFYDATGRSLGTADVFFLHKSSAIKAVKDLDGAKVDERPMYVKLVGGAIPTAAPKVVPNRQPAPSRPARSNAPRPAARSQQGGNKPRGGSRGGRGGRGGGRQREQKKPVSAADLDAEMDAYHTSTKPAAAAPVAAGQPPAPAAPATEQQ